MLLKSIKYLHFHLKPKSNFFRNASSNASRGDCIISSKRTKLNHYTTTVYDKFNEVPLISKGWNHSKSKGDSITLHPISEINQTGVPFNTFNLNPNIIQTLANETIEQATEFQTKVFDLFNREKHLLLAAETGSGKTLAYLLPIIENLINKKSSELNTPSALIVVPNRELAYQVGDVATKLASSVDLNVKVVVGGRTKRLMLDPEFSEIDILIGTPGTLSKLSTVGVYKLHNVSYSVFDEADTLIDDSFLDRFTILTKRVPNAKIILVTATMPKVLPDILQPLERTFEYVVSPKLHKPLINITQKFLRMTRSAKPSNLLQLTSKNNSPMLVFSNRNSTSCWLAMFLRENGIHCSNINGDMNYALRIQQWNAFISGETNILSATDVGSRGLDTKQVTHVINYDFPLYAADYLHRVGRVGRLGGKINCKVTNFISGPEEIELVQQIELAIRRNEALPNVDGNITNIIQKKIQKGIRQASLGLF